MKVVLFCGGKGVRIRRDASDLPKPLVRIGQRPILWHIMKYYAHYGHKDFVLCLGYKAHLIKKFFLEYDECVSNDFTITEGGERVDLVRKDIQDWRITFVDTGLNASIGQRLYAVRNYLAGEEMFLANYADGLSNLHLPTMIDQVRKSDATAGFLSVRPRQSFHVVRAAPDGLVDSIEVMSNADIWINAGYFVLRNSIFDHMKPGEELVNEPFGRLIQQRKLIAHRFEGFWASMDTFKEKQTLEAMHAEGKASWQVWT